MKTAHSMTAVVSTSDGEYVLVIGGYVGNTYTHTACALIDRLMLHFYKCTRYLTKITIIAQQHILQHCLLSLLFHSIHRLSSSCLVMD